MISIFARDVLEIGEQGFGFMVASRAVGSVIGVSALAVIGDRLPKGKTLLVASALFGLSLAAFGSQPWIVTAFIFLGVAGTMAAIFDTVQQAALQLAVGDGSTRQGDGHLGPRRSRTRRPPRRRRLAEFTNPQFAVVFNGLMHHS